MGIKLEYHTVDLDIVVENELARTAVRQLQEALDEWIKYGEEADGNK
jgi:hypothetical protein